MHDLSGRLKGFLNEQANIRLAQLGNSEPMIRDAKREAWWWLTVRGTALQRRRGRVLSGGRLDGSGARRVVACGSAASHGDEVTVELLTTVVSPGTERAQYLRLPNTTVSFPLRPGCSGAGIVIDTGRDVTKVRPGDLVAVRNVPHASVATVPTRSIHRIPEGVPLEAAAMVQLGVICSQGVRRAAVQPAEPVCVVGAGLVGTLAQRLATAVGAGPVTVTARSRAKEGIAMTGGAARFLVVDEDSEEIERLASPVVIEASGDPNAVTLAVGAAGENGRLVLLGSPRGAGTCARCRHPHQARCASSEPTSRRSARSPGRPAPNMYDSGSSDVSRSGRLRSALRRGSDRDGHRSTRGGHLLPAPGRVSRLVGGAVRLDAPRSGRAGRREPPLALPDLTGGART